MAGLLYVSGMFIMAYPEKVESGRSIEVDGFHDGGGTWRLRLMPTKLGTWEYRTRSADAGLDGTDGTLECVPPEKPYLKGPLQVRGHAHQHDGVLVERRHDLGAYDVARVLSGRHEGCMIR